MDTRAYIDVSALDLRKLVEAAFDRSRAQGLGFLHDAPGELTDEEYASGVRDRQISFDYLRGRSMKFHLHRDSDKTYWGYGWYDHSDRLQTAVLVAAGMGETDAVAAMDRAKAGLAERSAEYEKTA